MRLTLYYTYEVLVEDKKIIKLFCRFGELQILTRMPMEAVYEEVMNRREKPDVELEGIDEFDERTPVVILREHVFGYIILKMKKSQVTVPRLIN